MGEAMINAGWKERERVQEIHGYDSLIRDCCYHNVSAVADLVDGDGERETKGGRG